MSDVELAIESRKLDSHSADESSAARTPTDFSPDKSDDILDRVENADDDEDANEDTSPEALQSTRRSSISSALTFADSQKQVRCYNCTAEWSKQRKMLAVFGCLSSMIVCIIRLKIDPGYQTYTIHSVIVFFDMILIHLFTAARWLSITGESITIVSFLLYHYTKQKVWELLETTLLAMICSFHMISSRSQHWDREEELEGLIGLEIVPNGINATPVRRRSATVDQQASNGDQQKNLISAASLHTDRTMEVKESKSKLKLMSCSKHFFEHFLDGSAGVMYTSFLGLIIDEFIVWGSSTDGKDV